MRKVFLIFLILLPTITGAQFGEDEIIYHYFQGLIDKGHESLQNLTYNRKGEEISAEVFNVTENLEKYNIDHKLLEISPSFKTFLKSLNNIVLNYNRMIDYRTIENSQNFSIFKVSLKNVLENIAILNRSLDEIDNITLRDNKENILRFNTTNIRKDIDKILKNIKKYSKKLEYIEPEKRGFFVYVDKDTVYLNSKVRVYGYVNYGHNLHSIILIHNNKRYVVEVKNNSFSKDIYIKTLGDHIIYGISSFGSSNKVVVKCLKIPTYIEVYPRDNLTAHLEEEINLEVHLYDYYGHPLENRTVYIKYLNGEFRYNTPLNLRFKLDDRYIEYVNRSVPVDIIFKGDNVYNFSEKRCYIKILKIPTYITANYDNGYIVGNLYDFKNNPLDNKKIYLTVGNNTYSTTTENGSFRFQISKFKEGCIIFKGDRKYASSSKELSYGSILGGLWSPSDIYPLLFLIFVIILPFTIFKIYKERYKLDNKTEKREEQKYLDRNTKLDILHRFYKLVENKMFREAVIFAYQLFIRSLNIKRSYTPREICKVYREIPGIKTITEIFERIYYGDIPPTKKDVEEYERFLREKEGN